jgi:hypothetical protein
VIASKQYLSMFGNKLAHIYISVFQDGVRERICHSKLIQYGMVCVYGSILPRGTNYMEAKLIDSRKV